MLDQIMQWKERALKLVWQHQLAGLPLWEKLTVRSFQIVLALIRDLIDGQITLRAMSLVYTTLLSLVPLLALTFSVLKGFGVHNQLEPMLLNSLAPLGDQGIEITNKIIGFVENIKVGVLGAVGLGMLVYTVIALLHKVEQAFNFIWHVKKPRTFSERFSEYLSVLLVGPLLVFSALGLTATMMNSSIVHTVADVPGLGLIVASVGKLIPYLLVISAFTFIYMFMPNTKVRLLPALIGGVVSGIAWEASGWAFGTFVVGSGSYAAIYSGFAVLIVFLIWLFVSWLILLLGSSISFYIQYPEHFALKREETRISARMQERLSLLMLHYIAQHYQTGSSKWAAQDLAEWLRIPSNIVETMLLRLQRVGLIMPTNDTGIPFVPAMDMANMSLQQVFELIRAEGEAETADTWMLPEQADVDALLEKLAQARIEALADMRLRDLIS